MLKPEYYNNNEKIEKILEIYRTLENFILRDISRRLLSAGEMTATADRLIWKLKQMGESRRAIENKLSKLTGLTRYELKKLLQDAVMVSWENDKESMEQWLGNNTVKSPLVNPAVIRVMDAEYKKSLGELKNLTRTTMIQAGNDLVNMLDEADLRVAAGVQSYSAAVCDILDRYAGKGIYVDYPSGARRTLEAAVRCCIVTSAAQMAGQISAKYVVEGGIEYVVTSAHLGARIAQKGQPPCADHSAWQGRIFKIEGSAPDYPNLLESTGYDIDRINGVGKVVNPLGLYGYNCTHAWEPVGKDMKNPWRDENGNLIDGDGNRIDSEENKKRYQLQQKQRYMERAIKATKRKLIEKKEQINLVADPELKAKLQKDYDKLSYRMTQQNKAYNDFCKANDLQPQYDRIKVADFGREQTKAANAGARRYRKSTDSVMETVSETLAEHEDSGIIKLSESEQQAINKYLSSESYVLNDKLRRGVKLSTDEQKWVESLDSALDKMPEYKGTVYRSVSDFGIEDVDVFIKSHVVNGNFKSASYISSSEKVYDESFPIQYIIESKHGKDIRVYNQGEQEVLFKRNSKFYVNKIENNTIYLEEEE